MTLLQNSCLKLNKSLFFAKNILKRVIHKQLPFQGDNLRDRLFVPYHNEIPRKTRKVTVIGAAGQTGVLISFSLFIKNMCDELVMVDSRIKNVCGEALDMIHASHFNRVPDIKVCPSDDLYHTSNSNLIIVACSIPHKDIKDPLDLAKANVKIIETIIPPLAEQSPDCVFLVISPPVDILTYATWKYSCFDKNRIISIGTELDSARFRYQISKRLKINPYSIRGWIIGERGGTTIPVWSSVSVAGVRLRDLDPTIGTREDQNCWNQLHEEVMKDDEKIAKNKGFINSGIAQSTMNIAKSVLTNSRCIHAVSTQITGLYNLDSKCFLSVPCVIGNRGVDEVLKQTLDDDEIQKLKCSADIIDQMLCKLNL